MSYRTRLALGLAGGYLLGRYRKTRMLAAIVAAVAAKQLGDTVVKRSTEALGSQPELEKLAGYGREAAVAVLSNRINGLSQRIHDRTESIRQSLQPGGAEQTDQGDAGQEAQGDESAEPEEPPAGADDRQEQPGDEPQEQAGKEQPGDEPQEQAGKEQPGDEPQGQAGKERATARSGGKDAGSDRPPGKRQGGQPRSSEQGRRTQVSGRPSTTPGRG